MKMIYCQKYQCFARYTSRIAVIPDELTDLVYLRKTIVELKQQVQELTNIVLQLRNQRTDKALYK